MSRLRGDIPLPEFVIDKDLRPVERPHHRHVASFIQVRIHRADSLVRFDEARTEIQGESFTLSRDRISRLISSGTFPSPTSPFRSSSGSPIRQSRCTNRRRIIDRLSLILNTVSDRAVSLAPRKAILHHWVFDSYQNLHSESETQNRIKHTGFRNVVHALESDRQIYRIYACRLEKHSFFFRDSPY